MPRTRSSASNGAGGVQLRALTLRDLPRILEIDEANTGKRRGDADNDLWRLIAETTTCYGADHGGRLVGFVLADVRPWEFGNRAHVGWVIAIGVDPDHHGRGIGRLLGRRVVESFHALGVREIKTLVAGADKDLRKYFESLGFREAKEHVLRLQPAEARPSRLAKAGRGISQRRR